MQGPEKYSHFSRKEKNTKKVLAENFFCVYNQPYIQTGSAEILQFKSLSGQDSIHFGSFIRKTTSLKIQQEGENHGIIMPFSGCGLFMGLQ